MLASSPILYQSLSVPHTPVTQHAVIKSYKLIIKILTSNSMFKTLSGMGKPAFWSEQVLIFTEHKFWFHQWEKQGENLWWVRSGASVRRNSVWYLTSLFPFLLTIIFVTLQLYKTLGLPLALGKHLFFFLSFRVVWFKGRTKGNKAQCGVYVC